MKFEVADILSSHQQARKYLLTQREGGYWSGCLSSSALSTATSTFALHCADAAGNARTINCGVNWLASHQNADGGWGDTPSSPSNISTTLLAWSTLCVCGGDTLAAAAAKAKTRLESMCDSIDPASLAEAIDSAYGQDRTFSAPILTMCTLAGVLGDRGWDYVKPLPFELAACSHTWLNRLGLPVVSYALPALIAIGQVGHHHRKSKGPMGLIRDLARACTLRKLEAIQPADGGFLEAAPLTSFVVMSLASMNLKDHPVVRRGVEFLLRGVRADGSWPIDTNLSTWITTLSINALAASPDGAGFEIAEVDFLVQWLLDQQFKEVHPFTHSAPGGWGWSNLSGALPDADDTAGALIALHNLAPGKPEVVAAAHKGNDWLLGIQNSDGGIPTFCRGWGKLPFDSSSPDLTAHAIAAWSVWHEAFEQGQASRMANNIRRAIKKALRYLLDCRRPDGSFVPLWFGNQYSPDMANPVYGTAKVLLGLQCVSSWPGLMGQQATDLCQAGSDWLVHAQSSDGGWGGDVSCPASIEESALALEALTTCFRQGLARTNAVEDALWRGANWLVEHTGGGRYFSPSPIGLYFAKLWYHEDLYPLIFSTAAMGELASLVTKRA